jgi:DNA-binding CsgD family transcriptional regulator
MKLQETCELEADPGASKTAVIYQPEMLGSCCALVTSLHTVAPQQPQAWLARAAAGVSALIRPGTACWIMDAGLNDTDETSTGPGGWKVHAFAVEGCVSADAASKYRAQATRGFPAEDAGSHPVRQFGVPTNLCLPRADLYPAGTWAASSYRALCKETGVREFARFVTEFERESPRRWLVIEAQGLDDGWTVNADLLRVLSALGEGIARAYDHRFLRLARLRKELTNRISPAGHAVLPLLAQGLSEAEIGKRIHRSPHTVHDHVKQIYRALGVSSRLELYEVWNGEREPARS